MLFEYLGLETVAVEPGIDSRARLSAQDFSSKQDTPESRRPRPRSVSTVPEAATIRADDRERIDTMRSYESATALAFCAAAALAQQPTRAALPTFSESVEVRVLEPRRRRHRLQGRSPCRI